MFWNKRVAVLISALIIAAITISILTYVRRPSLEGLAGLNGPTADSIIADGQSSSWSVHADGSESRLAILLTDEDSSWLGLAEGLKSIGVPFLITRNTKAAVQHKVVLAYPAISGRLLDAEDLETLAQHVESGGTLIATQILGGGLQGVFGFDRIEEFRDHSEIRFSGSHPTLSFIDRPEERTVRIGNPDKDLHRIGTQAFVGATNILATYDDGSAAVVAHASKQGGQAYAIGFDLGFFILKSANGRNGGVSRNYANAYEPSVDTWLRWIKSVYTQSEPAAITLHSAPEGRDLAVVISFDIDYSNSMTNTRAFSDLLSELGIPGTFFIQTKYFDDYNDKAFFNDFTLPIVQHLNESGMEVASHSVTHAKTFSDMPLGEGSERFPDYQPRVLNEGRTWNASILGELRVSKYLLEQVTETEVVSFRPGYLATPARLPEALDASGYKYASSATSGNVLTHLPYRMNFSRGYDSATGVFQFPIAIEDEIPPHMNLREEPAVDLAKRLAEYGGCYVVLIHPNVTKEKIEFLNAVVPELKRFAWFGTLQQFGDWWTMRDSVSVDARIFEDEMVITVDSELPIQGLRLDLDTDWIPQSPLPDGVSVSPGSVYIAEAGTELSITMNMPSTDR